MNSKSTATRPGQSRERPELDHLSVLAVDDDPYLLALTKRVLEGEYGLHVETAENALDACRVLRDRPVDCVVSDYRMPAVDGLDLLEVIRETDDDLPFVMFTNKGSERVETRVREAAATEYVRKDLGLDQYDRLIDAIAAVVDDAADGKAA